MSPRTSVTKIRLFLRLLELLTICRISSVTLTPLMMHL